MIPSLVVLVGLFVQATGPRPLARATRAPDPVRVWRADSIAYITLREPGHLLLLNVDPIGRITVLFPFGPFDSTGVVDAGVPFAVPLPPQVHGNPATLVAVRSRWAFDFAALRGGAGGTWDYQNAWLLQPTAGDPLGALLDIADRVTDGRPYDYGGVKYSRDGSVAALGLPVQPDVCLSCVSRGTSVASAPAPAPTNAVDCSNASLTNSFCGVNSGSVSITSVPQAAYQPAPAAAPAPAAVYVRYYVPMFIHGEHRRFDRPMIPPPSVPRPSAAAAFSIAPRLVVPSSTDLRTFSHRRP